VGLEAVIQEILEKGRQESAALVEGAKGERERLLGEARKEMAAVMVQREAEANAAAERRRVQDLARAELEAKRLVLNGQREVLDQVYQEATHALRDLVDGALLGRLLTANAAAWRSGKVFSNARDERSVRAIVGSAYAGTIACAGGVVIEAEGGAKRLDLRYETLLKGVWDDALREVARTLWPA